MFNSHTFNLVDDLRSIKGTPDTKVNVLGYHSIDDGTTGEFYWDDISTEDDNGGTVIKVDDVPTGRWKRIFQGSTINLRWFGAKATTLLEPFDSFDAFQTAYQYIKDNPRFNTIYIPADLSSIYGYEFSETLVLDTRINILGDGPQGNPTTLLRFPENTLCINIPHGEFTHNVSLKHLAINQVQALVPDTTKHAISFNVFCNFENISIINCSGNAFNGVACANDPEDPEYGNIDLSQIIDCIATFCENGLYLSGCDANVLFIKNFNVSNARRWGIWDNGFLGNYYVSCHFAANGSYVNNTSAQYNGINYQALNHTIGDNINKRPDLFPELWGVVTSPLSTAEWEDDVSYKSGGTFLVSDPNAWSMFMSCYTEEYQPPARLNGRSMAVNGDMGTPVGSGGLWMYMAINELYMRNTTRINITPIEAGGTYIMFDTNPTQGITNTTDPFNSDPDAAKIKITPYGVNHLGFSYSATGLGWETGTPFISLTKRLGFYTAADTIGQSGAGISFSPVAPDTGNAWDGTYFNMGDIIFNSDFYHKDSTSLCWRVNNLGEIGDTINKNNIVEVNVPYTRRFTSTDDSWIIFFSIPLNYEYTDYLAVYRIKISATTAAGDIWHEERKLVYKRLGGTPSLISNDEIGTTTKDAALSTADFQFNFDVTNYNFEVKGLPSDNVNFTVTFEKEITQIL